MVYVKDRPLIGYIGKVKRTRAHYHLKFLPWCISKHLLFQFVLLGRLAPMRFITSQKIWWTTPLFGIPIPIGLSEIKYHNILESDDGNIYLISWDYVHDTTIFDAPPTILRFDDIIQDKRVLIKAYWTVEHKGMSDNLGLGTSDVEHYPDLNKVEILQ